MPSMNYTFKEFNQCYQEEISHILSIVNTRCKDTKSVIYDKQNLFKQLVAYIYHSSDIKKLKLSTQI